jgi:2'-hydroxyisoflavone reductase
VKILVLGGTVFLGRHLVEAALDRGDEVTILTRGRTSPHLFPDVERLQGNRDGDLGALAGRAWDAVVDTSGFVPRMVRQSAQLLRASVQLYCFVSSVSVYADFSTGPTEESAVQALEDPSDEDVDQRYGALKATCEGVVRELYDDRALVLRPGLIVGPHDPTGRFTYWPVRIARGGEVLAPTPPGRGVQFVDARDLARWTLDLAARRQGGTFNAVGEPTTFERLLTACADGAAATASIEWVDELFLLDNGIAPWTELPLWLPGAEWVGHADVRAARALAAGLSPRPLSATVRDTLAWARTLTGDPERQEDGRYRVKTLAPERERELLAAWHAR